MDEWHDFFLAQAGAAGVLTGLVFVGVSINLQKIISRVRAAGYRPGRGSPDPAVSRAYCVHLAAGARAGHFRSIGGEVLVVGLGGVGLDSDHPVASAFGTGRRYHPACDCPSCCA